MSRLRQNNSGNYNSSGNIDAEFENFVRYINSAEYGNKTLAELLALCFNTSTGEFDANVELRVDAVNGLEYRSGDYTNSEDGWSTVAAIDEIRGLAGVDVGTIGEPFFNSRFAFTAAGGETEIDISHDATDALIVYKNGLLQTITDDYTEDPNGGTGSAGSITFLVALSASDVIAIFKLTEDSAFTLGRSDFTTVGAQSVFGYAFDAEDSITVYLNGVLQTEGGGEDYLLDEPNDSVNFNTPVPDANNVSIISAQPKNTTTIVGLMTEAKYTDNNGYILYSTLSIADDDIPQAKVNGLVTFVAATPDFEAGATTPAGLTRFWLDTSVTPNQLKFYDGTQYLSANPASSVPSFDETDGLTFLRVDATGTSLSFEAVDFSALVAKTQKAAVNGVASLDSSARIPVAQLPEVITYDTYDAFLGTVADGSLRIIRMLGYEVTITRIDVRTSQGTCNVQIEVDGVVTGATYAASVTPNSATLGSPVDVDATGTSKLIGVAITSSSGSPQDLEVALTIQVKSQ